MKNVKTWIESNKVRLLIFSIAVVFYIFLNSLPYANIFLQNMQYAAIFFSLVSFFIFTPSDKVIVISLLFLIVVQIAMEFISLHVFYEEVGVIIIMGVILIFSRFMYRLIRNLETD